MKNYCDCGKPLDYQQCCGALHQGLAIAGSAEQLMRSRFSAFSRGNVDYIIKTQTPLPAKASRTELEKDIASTRWLKLEVLKYDSASQTQAFVEFCAYAFNLSCDRKQLIKHHEYSEFLSEDGHWLYKQGQILPDSGPAKWQRNAQCVCGSGYKFKRCCGA